MRFAPGLPLLALLAALWLAPSPALAALTQEQAVPLLLGWIRATHPGLAAPDCLKAAGVTPRFGGFTVEVDATACGPDAAGAGGAWRIDAFTGEVFKAGEAGRFVTPPSVKGKPPLANAAILAGKADALPPGARLVETALIPGVPGRAFLLWMAAPTRSEHPKDQEYTCPDYSRGSCWSGPTRLSVVDVDQGVVRHTLPVVDPLERTDAFDLPYAIPAGPEFAYSVPQPAGKDRAGRPELLRLRDLTGDGQAREFHLATAGNCMLMLFSVFGYNAEKDEAVQYPVSLTVRQGQAAPSSAEALWLNFWPLRKDPREPRWRWDVDSRGRGGCLERFDVRFDPQAGRFQGQMTVTECEPGS